METKELSVKLFAAIVKAIQEIKGEEIIASDNTKFKELQLDNEQKIKIAHKVEVQDEDLPTLSGLDVERTQTIGQMVSAYVEKF